MLEGFIQQTGKSAAYPVTIQLLDQGNFSIEFLNAEAASPVLPQQEWLVSALEITSVPPGVPIDIILTDDWSLTINDSVSFNEWASAWKKDRLFFLEHKARYALASIIIVPAMLWLLVTSGIPALAKVTAPMIPLDMLRTSSEQTLLVLDEYLFEASLLSEDRKRVLTERWNEIFTQLKLNQKSYELHFRQSEAIGANAMALPGGIVIVTDDLITLLKDKDDALIAILLHEIGHVERNHGLQTIIEAGSMGLVTSVVFGDMEGAMEYITGAAMTLLQNKFSRAHETDADRWAIERLPQIGLDPESFATAIEALSALDTEVSGLGHYLGTHPAASERIRMAKEFAKTHR